MDTHEQGAETAATTPRPISGFTGMGEALRELQRYWQGVGMGVADDGPAAPPPACARCGDVRFLRRNVPYGDPDFGKLIRCPDCTPAVREPSPRELEDLERDRLAALAGLGTFQRAKTFETFALVPGSRDAFSRARDFAEHPQGWLALRGKPGSGKTHLGLAIANHALEQLRPVRWWYAPELVEEARRLRGADPGAEAAEYFELKRQLRDVELLVLDDFGGIHPSEFAVKDFLQPVLDARYRERRPTVFTLVSSTQDVRERLSDAIGRRMQDPEVCQVVLNNAEQWGVKPQ